MLSPDGRQSSPRRPQAAPTALGGHGRPQATPGGHGHPQEPPGGQSGPWPTSVAPRMQQAAPDGTRRPSGGIRTLGGPRPLQD